MKLGPVTKPDMGNTSTSKKVDHDAMSTNRDVIVFLPIHGQFAAIQKTHSGSMVYKTYIFILQILKTELKNLFSNLYCFE